MIWEVIGPGLPPLRIRAESFGQALRRARLRDPGYCAGYVVED